MYLQYGFSIFGRTIYSKNQRKFKSPWFNKDCFIARQQFRKSHRVYRKNTSYINANILLSKKRHYVNTKKKARYSYNRQMRDKLTGLAKNIAKAFWNEINKARKRHDANPSISNLQFFNYFKETFSGGDIFTNPDIENELHSKESSNICIDLLDREIETDYVKRAISALKRGKSEGADLLIPEMFLECKEILSPILCKLFNYMYDKCVYPSLGVIVPVPKEGDNSYVNKYRGITLTSIFSKILSHIIEKRLRDWAEQNTVISDCIFILNSLI